MVDAPELQTNRLVLRRPKIGDWFFFSALVAHKQVRKHLGGPVPWRIRLRQFKTYLKSHPDLYVWFVSKKNSQSLIGQIVLAPYRDGKNYEISYQFHPCHWGTGFALEAAKEILDFAARDLKMTRVVAETQVANTRSCQLLERLGMNEVERLVRFDAEQVVFATALPLNELSADLGNDQVG